MVIFLINPEPPHYTDGLKVESISKKFRWKPKKSEPKSPSKTWPNGKKTISRYNLATTISRQQFSIFKKFLRYIEIIISGYSSARYCNNRKISLAISVKSVSPSRWFLVMQNLLVSFLATSAASMPCHVVSPHLNNSQHASRIKGQCNRYDRSDFGTYEADIFYKAAEKM